LSKVDRFTSNQDQSGHWPHCMHMLLFVTICNIWKGYMSHWPPGVFN